MRAEREVAQHHSARDRGGVGGGHELRHALVHDQTAYAARQQQLRGLVGEHPWGRRRDLQRAGDQATRVLWQVLGIFESAAGHERLTDREQVQRADDPQRDVTAASAQRDRVEREDLTHGELIALAGSLVQPDRRRDEARERSFERGLLEQRWHPPREHLRERRSARHRARDVEQLASGLGPRRVRARESRPRSSPVPNLGGERLREIVQVRAIRHLHG